MKNIQNLRHMREVGWIAGLPADLQEALLSSAEVRERTVGASIYREGDTPGGLFGLVSGSLGVLATLGPFAPRLVHVARPGWWVGEASMVSGTRTRVEVRARTPSTIAVVSAATIAEVARSAPDIWRFLNVLTVAHLDNALLFAGCVLAPGARERIAATLLRLSAPQPPECEAVELRVSQSELAELAGLSRNSVGPVLRELQAGGTIRCRRSAIIIDDLSRISKLLGN